MEKLGGTWLLTGYLLQIVGLIGSHPLRLFWSQGTVVCKPEQLAVPTTVAEVGALVAGHKRVRAAGAGHSYNSFVCASDLIVSTANLTQVPTPPYDGPPAQVDSCQGSRPFFYPPRWWPWTLRRAR
jgi:hypothetical protein